MVQKLNYHLYIEFWSHQKKKQHVLLVVERDFKSISELRSIKEKIDLILGGEF
jgi:hypothetical protein